jgi:hypothetical protein
MILRAGFSRLSFAVIFTLLFSVVAGISILHHEMWSDELQVWTLAKAASSFPNLLERMRYEGHPALWHSVIYLFTGFSGPGILKVLCLVLSSLSVYLLLYFAPFSRLAKILCISGYFILYEYTTISRSYALGMALLFAAAALFPLRRQHSTGLALLLFLLAQTSLFGFIFSSGFLLLLCADRYYYPEHRPRPAVEATSLVLIIAGLVLSAVQMTPPPDSSAPPWHFLPLSDIPKAVTTVFKSYIPIPEHRDNFWSSHLILSKPVKTIGTGLFLLIVSIRLVRQPLALLFFWACNGAMWLFFYVKMYGAIRHHGHVFLVLIAALWVAGSYAPVKLPRTFPDRLLNLVEKKVFPAFFTVVLLVQLYSGVFAVYKDITLPFSTSVYATQYIRERGLDSLDMAGDIDGAAASIGAMLGKPVYYPSRHGWGTYLIWDKKRREIVNSDEVIREVRQLALVNNKDILLIMNRPVHRPQYRFLQPLAGFRAFIVPEESHYLYLIKARP